MLIRLCFCLLFIDFSTSISSQEDLMISKYFHIGCLKLNSSNDFLLNQIQESSALLYQTFSSSTMTIELCFRLCRLWKILINENRTLCMCLYRISNRHEFRESLGDVISTNECESNNLRIYSLTSDFYLLTPLPAAPYDWVLDGCYYLHGIQTYGANLVLSNSNHDLALEQCRNHCQMMRQGNSISFFLSRKKSCYCSPNGVPLTALSMAVRKPLMHCSFISSIRDGFESSINASEINADTIVKIDLKRYCSSSSYVFNRVLHRCLNLIPIGFRRNFVDINVSEKCLPILIKTSEQFSHLLSLPILLRTRVTTRIDTNSTHIFEDLLKSGKYASRKNDLCLVLLKTQMNRPSTYDIFPCPNTYSSGYIFCSQKALERITSEQLQFRIVNSSESTSITVNMTCPSDFVRFNNMCYYVHLSYVFNVTEGDEFCSSKYSNSTLVRFDSHVWGNVNSTGFLGRSFNDILLEFFYYQLEKKLQIETNNVSSQKHWLRLLIGDTADPNECVLRYFIRRLGAFTTLARCDHGGHPVCQHELIPMSSILRVENTTSIRNDSFDIYIRDEASIVNTTLRTNHSNTSYEGFITICNNCTSMIPDEDLPINETEFESTSNSNLMNSTTKYERFNFRSPLGIAVGAFLALVVCTISSILLICYARHRFGSYYMRNSLRRSSHRVELRSPLGIANPPSNRFAVLYQRLKSSPQSATNNLQSSPICDNAPVNDDTIHLLPQSIDNAKQIQNLITKGVVVEDGGGGEEEEEEK